MPSFPTAVAATSEGTNPSLESDRSKRGQLEQGGAAGASRWEFSVSIAVGL